jgi:hypothetical protein
MRRSANRKKAQAPVRCKVRKVRPDQRGRNTAPKVVEMGEQPIIEGPVPRGMPAEVRMLGQRWRVVYSPNLLSRDMYGFADPAKHRILVDSSQSREGMIQTLVHELLHAAFHVGPISYEFDSDQEERIVRQIAPVLVDMLRSNRAWWL